MKNCLRCRTDENLESSIIEKARGWRNLEVVLEDEEYVARKQEAALVAEEAVEVLAVGRRARSVG